MKKSKSTEIARRSADPNHDVVSVLGGDLYRRQPCAECPWRRDAPVGAFPAEAYRISANTAHDLAGSTFACHMKGTRDPAVCAGFLLRGAAHNMAVRMGCLSGHFDLSQVKEGGVDLYDSYREMAEANGVDPEDEALRRCRDF